MVKEAIEKILALAGMPLKSMEEKGASQTKSTKIHLASWQKYDIK
jgi:hypothetical protein